MKNNACERPKNQPKINIMSCCNPMKAFWTGQFTDQGKLDLVIMPGTSGNLLHVGMAEKKARHRISPAAPLVRIGGNTYITDPISIPCGHCVGCRMDAAQQWKVRCCDQWKDVDPARLHFITLTYSPWRLPVTKDGEPYLRKSDLDDFMMRLRRPEYGVKKDIKFFACGEYGENFHRPHYHAVIEYDLDDLIPYAWQCSHSATIDKAWRSRGLTQVKPVEPNLIAYVCGYCEKKQNDPCWDDYPVKPFTSKSKGLGFNCLDALEAEFDRKVYGNYGSTHFASIPRAYLRKCEDKPWFPEFKRRSLELGRLALSNKIGAFKTTDEEVIGFMIESSLLDKLEDKRIPKL